jgi:hypothetical protein
MNKRARIVPMTLTLLAIAPVLARAGSPPPPEIVNLDREVSLRLAHVRDQGPVEDTKRHQLSQAADLEQKSEKEIAAGDYKDAESDLLAAKTILDNLGD